MPPRRATAYAPAAISNFFSAVSPERPTGGLDFSRAGATGGGYILDRGTLSTAVVTDGGAGGVAVSVNGDPSYDAKTTRKAVELLLEAHPRRFGALSLSQSVQVPIGFGFGSSSASALSAVLAAAAALGIRRPKSDLAYFAHVAEIVSGTGLGTVSVAYDSTGAGAIMKAGAPGCARFLRVKAPASARIVTACAAAMQKSVVLSSPAKRSLARRLGDEALARVVGEPKLEVLAAEGEWFSGRLGIMGSAARRLAEAAKRAGAEYASQNMIGQAVHAIVDEDRAVRVAAKMAELAGAASVDVFEPGRMRAGLLPSRR